MTSDSDVTISKTMRWTGYIASALPVLLLLFSAFGKFFKPDGMEANIAKLGWRMDQMTALGIIEIACIVVYLVPRTSIFGAVLITAYLGGATAAHVRIDDQYFIPIIAGILVWIGIYLREPRLWPLAPFRK